MSSAVARPMIRQSANLSRMAARRFESTTTAKAAEAAKESASKVTATASEYATKATEGLSKVTSSAGPAIAGAAQGVAKSLGRVGGPIGRTVSFIEKQTPTAIYYSRVGLELGKLVFRGQKMTPPSVSTFQSYFQGAWKAVQNPSTLLQSASKASQQSASLVQQARNVNTAQLVAVGVIAAECIGFFTVGEMIGRFKIVGYHGGSPAHH